MNVQATHVTGYQHFLEPARKGMLLVLVSLAPPPPQKHVHGAVKLILTYFYGDGNTQVRFNVGMV